MEADQGAHGYRQDHDVEAIHLAKVEHVEEGAHADGIQGVLALHGDPLRVKVLLRDIAGKGGADAHEKAEHADDPGRPASVTPGALEEGGPEMEYHEKEERLHAPEVDAVDVVAQTGDVPRSEEH